MNYQKYNAKKDNSEFIYKSRVTDYNDAFEFPANGNFFRNFVILRLNVKCISYKEIKT